MNKPLSFKRRYINQLAEVLYRNKWPKRELREYLSDCYDDIAERYDDYLSSNTKSNNEMKKEKCDHQWHFVSYDFSKSKTSSASDGYDYKFVCDSCGKTKHVREKE